MKCPITQANIEVFGITCIGNIYEYDAITQWLSEHATDPVTNLILPTKFVVKHGNAATVTLRANRIKENLGSWCPNFMDTISGRERQRLKSLQVLQQRLQTNAEFQAYAAAVDLLYYMHDAYAQQFEKCANAQLPQRPPNTGKGLQALQFKNLTLRGKSFKNERFDMCKFTDCAFIGCNFGQASFRGAVFDGVFLRNCCFGYGGGSMFTGATGTITVERPIQCEYFTWREGKTLGDFGAILQQRGFAGKVSVVKRPSNTITLRA